MRSNLVGALDWLSHWVFVGALTLFLAVNLAAVAAVVIGRDRRIVDRWTTRWLATNLVALGAGAGVPLLVSLVKLIVLAALAGGGSGTHSGGK